MVLVCPSELKSEQIKQPSSKGNVLKSFLVILRDHFTFLLTLLVVMLWLRLLMFFILETTTEFGSSCQSVRENQISLPIFGNDTIKRCQF